MVGTRTPSICGVVVACRRSCMQLKLQPRGTRSCSQWNSNMYWLQQKVAFAATPRSCTGCNWKLRLLQLKDALATTLKVKVVPAATQSCVCGNYNLRWLQLNVAFAATKSCVGSKQLFNSKLYWLQHMLRLRQLQVVMAATLQYWLQLKVAFAATPTRLRCRLPLELILGRGVQPKEAQRLLPPHYVLLQLQMIPPRVYLNRHRPCVRQLRVQRSIYQY